jgi:hypothetical protein
MSMGPGFMSERMAGSKPRRAGPRREGNGATDTKACRSAAEEKDKKTLGEAAALRKVGRRAKNWSATMVRRSPGDCPPARFRISHSEWGHCSLPVRWAAHPSTARLRNGGEHGRQGSSALARRPRRASQCYATDLSAQSGLRGTIPARHRGRARRVCRRHGRRGAGATSQPGWSPGLGRSHLRRADPSHA